MLRQYRLLSIIFFAVIILSVHSSEAKKSKYIFLFIGDGMGVCQRSSAEAVLKTSKQPVLWMNSLPVKGEIVTCSYGKKVTDSAAAATALACGVKTHNQMLGVEADGKSRESVAEIALKSGFKVGILSSVYLNHATPAGFYAHRPRRSMYNKIVEDLAASNFDYFGGYTPKINGKRERERLYGLLEDSGYILVDAQKGIPTLKPDKKYIVHKEMPYVIDRKIGDAVTLPKLTSLGIEHLYRGKGKDNGFFMMVEGGKIDWSCHSNDFGGMVQEVREFDQAVKVALEFYRKHPRLTTIVVTADHETGGLRKLKGEYASGLKCLPQSQSYAVMCRKLDVVRKQNAGFNEIISLLKKWYGIRKLSAEEKQRLSVLWEKSRKQTKGGKSTKNILYGSFKPLIFCMQKIYCSRMGIEWGTTSHTGQNVPVTAIGVGAENFSGTYDNTQIAVKLRALIAGDIPGKKMKD